MLTRNKISNAPLASGIRLAGIVFLMLAVFLYTKYAGSVQSVPLLRSLDQFPDTIGTFSRSDTYTFTPEIIDSAGMDNYIMWQFMDTDGYTLGLYIGYYQAQHKNELIHSPKHCLPGSGWSTEQQQQISIQLPANNQHQKINRLLMQNGMERQLVQFWYQGRGHVIASEYLDRALMVWDSLTRRRSDGSLVRLTGPGDDLERDTEKQQQFITALLPILDQFIPN